MKLVRLSHKDEDKQFITIVSKDSVSKIIESMYTDFGTLPYTFNTGEIIIDLEAPGSGYKGVKGLEEYIKKIDSEAMINMFSILGGKRFYFKMIKTPGDEGEERIFPAYPFRLDDKKNTKKTIFNKHMLITINKIEKELGKAEALKQLQEFLRLYFEKEYRLSKTTGLV